MKKSSQPMKRIKILAIAVLFLSNLTFVSAQECLPETRMDNEEDNKQAAKAIKFYCMDNKVAVGKKKMKCEYLRHAFLKDWRVFTNANDEEIRNSYIGVGVKSETGECSVVIFRIYQIGVGGNKWGGFVISDSGDEIKKLSEQYFKQLADCDCIIKENNWLGSNAKTTSTENQTANSTKVIENISQPSNNTSSSNVISSKDATGLPPLDKKKAGYYSVPDGDNLSEEGYKVKNKLEGEFRSYTQGKLEFVYNMKNGKKEGAASEYWPNGKIKKSGVYKDGKKDGEWKKFTEAGKPAGTDVYLNGEKQ